MKALISPQEPLFTGCRIADVCAVEFEVAPPLFWVPVGESVKPETHYYDEQQKTCLLVPGPTLAQVQGTACTAIDTAAGIARARYITVAPGQEATYILKDRQARDYKAAGYLLAGVDAYPYVHAEARAMYGPSPTALQCQAAADAIIAMADLWLAKGSQIEELRIGGKRTVDAAQTIAAAQAASVAAVAALAAI